MEKPRLEVPDGPVLAGDELVAVAVVGASGRWIRIATNAQLTAVDDEDVGYWLWAAHGEQDAGWSRLTGPGPCSHSFSNGPVAFTLPPQITTGRYLLEVGLVGIAEVSPDSITELPQA